VFSEGTTGAIHVLAHEALDRGDIALGARELGPWLAYHRGSGSEWAHLHFHMGVFEIALGHWQSAYRRFMREILPASMRGDAATDGPGLLWRLALSAPPQVALPWAAVRRAALSQIRWESDPFVELHHLLAFAGAADTVQIEAWLSRQPRTESRTRTTLRRAAVALLAVSKGAYGPAAEQLRQVLPDLARIGGSRAQNELFPTLERWCHAQSLCRQPNALEAVAA